MSDSQLVTLTNQIIFSGASCPSGGWTRSQLKILGVSWPPPKGWKSRLLGSQVPEAKVKEFIRLRGVASRVPNPNRSIDEKPSVAKKQSHVPKWVRLIEALIRDAEVTCFYFLWLRDSPTTVEIIHEQTSTKFGTYDNVNKVFKFEGGGWTFDCNVVKAAETIVSRVARESFSDCY